MKTRSTSAFILGALTTVLIAGCSNPQPSQITQLQPQSENVAVNLQTPTQQEQLKFQEKKIGEAATVSGLTFKVNSSQETKTLTAKYSSPKAARSGTKFIIVDISVTNEGISDAMFSPNDNFRLVDAKNRQYTTYSESIGKIDNYLDVRKLAPGIPESGVLVYEVPEDVELYGFVGTDAVNTGYVIILKGKTDSSTEEKGGN